MLPQVSVVLPVRDGADTLPEAVRSVLASRDVSLELVCVDDGSGDATSRILREASRADGRVRVIRTGPRGISAALQTGLEHARAGLVARMDADDEMHPERLAEQRALLEREPTIALAGCLVEPFRDGAGNGDGIGMGWRIYADWVNGLVSADEIEREAFVECPIPHPTWMFRAEVVRALGGYRECAWPEDVDLFYRLLEAGGRAAKVARVLHRWRDHDARLSRTSPRYAKPAFLRAKAHFVPRLHPMPAAVVWGAGRTGRRMVRLLADEGLSTRVLLDVNRRRIGSEWRGIPILSPARIGECAPAWRREGLRILAAVSSRGARAEIRAELVGLRLDEGTDFLMVA